MRILLTGRNGQVGWELERVLPALGEVVATDRTTLDLADNDSIRRAVREAKPGVILNAAAYTAVDKAEAERELATQVNGIAPAVLAEEAKGIGALLVHYSTDYVFDGAKRSPYREDDAPNPLSHYARTKLQGEQAIGGTGCRHLILRTSWVYGPRTTNFYRIIVTKARAGEAMRMVDDQTSVPTPARFLAEQTVGLLEAEAQGLVHLVPTGHTTRYGFAREVVKATGSKSKVEAARTSDFPTPAARPSYSAMDNRKAARLARATLPEWQALLRTAITEWRY